MEDSIQGPLVAELQETAPQAFADRIKRSGIVNAMHDPNFGSAVNASQADPFQIVSGHDERKRDVSCIALPGGRCQGRPLRIVLPNAD